MIDELINCRTVSIPFSVHCEKYVFDIHRIFISSWEV